MLCICIDRYELDTFKADIDHSINSVNSTATNADDFDDR
jgi:hypothetical protein